MKIYPSANLMAKSLFFPSEIAKICKIYLQNHPYYKSKYETSIRVITPLIKKYTFKENKLTAVKGTHFKLWIMFLNPKKTPDWIILSIDWDKAKTRLIPQFYNFQLIKNNSGDPTLRKTLHHANVIKLIWVWSQLKNLQFRKENLPLKFCIINFPMIKKSSSQTSLSSSRNLIDLGQEDQLF